MKIGARAHDFDGGAQPTPAGKLAQIKQAGYECIQLAPAKLMPEIGNMHQVEQTHIEQLREILTAQALPVAVLGCYIEPALADRRERLAQVATFQQYLEYAKILGAPLVGTETTPFPVAAGADREQAYARLLDSMKRLVETAERVGVDIGVEPVAEHTLNTTELTRRLLDEVGSPRLQVILDPANLLRPGDVSQQAAVFAWARADLKNDVAALHVKNFVVHEGRKELCALAAGVIDFTRLAAWLKAAKPGLPVLRENSLRASDAADMVYLQALFGPEETAF